MLKQLIIISSIVLGIVLLSMYIFQRHLIYIPDRHTPRLQKYHANDMTIVSLHTKDNLVLNSWYKPAMKGRPTILYLHGNAGHIGYRMPIVRQFIDAGLGVLLLEYRGYGGNKGKPTEQGLYEDGYSALRFLNKKGIKSEKLVLYGESLGTGVATQLALNHPVCAVILQSPFTSLDSMAHFHYPWIMIKPWDHFNSSERIKKIHAPLLVAHGKQDQVVPYIDGLTLFNEANEPKKMLSFELKNHHDLWSAPNFSKEIIKFIQVYCRT